MSVFKRWNGTQWETIGPGVTSARFNNINNMIAPEFDPKNTYNVGDYVVQSDKLYRCINRIGTPQAWKGENWREVKLGQDVTELRNDVVAVSDTQPTSENNRIWVKPNNESMVIPLIEDVMMLPNPNDYGENDQIPRSTGTGIEWVNYGLPTDEQTAAAINAWLTAHPEATTTVQDHSLTHIKLVNGTLGFVTPEMYGAKGDGIIDDTEAVQKAVNYGKAVFFSNKYKVGSISVNSATHLIGVNGLDSCLINKTGSYELFAINSNDVILDRLSLKGESRDSALVKVLNGENITINKCLMSNADFGVWVCPLSGDSVKRIKITNNESSQIVHHVSLGMGEHQTVGAIEDVIIDGNTMNDSIFNHVGNGIKTVQKCHNLIITNNIISEQDLDGIDLFASGNRILVANNILKNNYIVGIDIKRNNVDYDESMWGVTGNIDISHNIIEGNRNYGIIINTEANSTKQNYIFNISHNRIVGNGGAGLYSRASYVNIIGNFFYKNGRLGTTENMGIAIDGARIPVYGVNICDNQIINNGYFNAPESQQSPVGIYLSQKIHDVNICNNIIANASDLDNAYQRYGITIGNNDITNVTVKNNKISSGSKDVVTIVQNNILAEKNEIVVNEVIARVGSQDEYKYIAIAETDISLVNCVIDFFDAVPQGNTTDGYVVFYVFRLDGETETTITYYNTSSAGISKNTSLKIAFDARKQNVAFSKGEVYGIRMQGVYGGQNLPISRIVFNYIER